MNEKESIPDKTNRDTASFLQIIAYEISITFSIYHLQQLSWEFLDHKKVCKDDEFLDYKELKLRKPVYGQRRERPGTDDSPLRHYKDKLCFLSVLHKLNSAFHLFVTATLD